MAGKLKRKRYLIRENIKFQIKLTLDAGRDLLLSPVSFVCTLVDLLVGNNIENGLFQRLMRLGHNTDRWLNLFGETSLDIQKADKDSSEKTHENDLSIVNNQDNSNENSHQGMYSEQNPVDTNLDNLFTKVEILLNEQHENGKLTLAAKKKINRYLDKISSNSNEKNTPSL